MLRIIPTLFLILFFELTVTPQAPQAPEPAIPDRQNNGSKAADRNAAFIESIKTGDVSQVLQLLDVSISPDTTDDEGTPALHWSVRMNRPQIAEILLARKAGVDKEDHNGGNTALHIAAVEGRSDLVKLLIKFGADVNHKDSAGHTALMCAAFGATLRSAPVWLASSFYEIDEDDDLFRMMGSEHHQAAKLLLEAGANVNAQGKDCGLTVLMIAALGGNVELTKLLLERHADLNLGDGNWTALRYAETIDSPQGLKDILADIDDQDSRQTFLNWVHLTAASRRAVATMLRKAGANQTTLLNYSNR